MKLYKFLRLKNNKIVSQSGKQTWKVNKWVHVNGNLSLCEWGLHASETPYQAFSYVSGEILAIVETKGNSLKENDKQVWSAMKIIKAYKWTKKDSVAFALYASELVLKFYEEKYPDDKRPREAIKAARKVLFHDTAKNRAAAYIAAYTAAYTAAHAAAYTAAYTAAHAAYIAAYTAAHAAHIAAYTAAYTAAHAAYTAHAAHAAAYTAHAAHAAMYKKLGNWMVRRIKTLKEIK